VQEAVQQGAKCLVGGHVNSSAGCPGGFMQPTLLVDVTTEMRIAKEEVFGPVMVLMKAKNDEDAIRIVRRTRGDKEVTFLLFLDFPKANAGEYGLGSSVFSKDYARAERIARRLVTGVEEPKWIFCL